MIRLMKKADPHSERFGSSRLTNSRREVKGSSPSLTVSDGPSALDLLSKL